uniref:Uncharacterized protein n=1 Tax=Rhizophora mucronata TaxID=61149 RepID=A0A2P2N0L7_RHIMU
MGLLTMVAIKSQFRSPYFPLHIDHEKCYKPTTMTTSDSAKKNTIYQVITWPGQK